MANELRKIAFNMVEVHGALEIFGQKTGNVIPVEPVSSVSAEGAGRLAVTFANGKSLKLGDKDMTAALLIFCQDKSIPVPKGAKKVLKVEDKSVIMMIKMG